MSYSIWKVHPGWEYYELDGRHYFSSDTRTLSISGDLSDLFPDGIIPDDRQIRFYSSKYQRLLENLENEGIVSYRDHKESQKIYNNESRLVQFYNHFGLNGEYIIKKVSDANVIIYGLGGLGSIVLQHLVSAGVKNFILVDNDLIEKRNLEQQFIYHKSQIGLKKTTVSKEFIRKFIKSPKVKTHDTFLHSKEDVTRTIQGVSCDIAVICIDQPPNEAYLTKLWGR